MFDSLKEQGKEKWYGKSIGNYNGLVILGLAIAMGIGGYLQEISWSYVFIAGIVTQLIAMAVITQLTEIKFENSEHETQTVGDILKEVKDFFRLNKAFKYLVLSLSVFFAITSVLYVRTRFVKSGRAVRAQYIHYFCGTVHLAGAVLHLFFQAGGKIHAEARASADILYHRGGLSVYTIGQSVRDDCSFCRH